MGKVPSSSEQPRVALVYDRVNSWGGAERVLLALQELYPSAPLYTSVYDAQAAEWAQNFQVKTSFLQRYSWLRSRHRWLGWLMPLAFETLDLSEYDIVISVTSEAAKAVITTPEQLHICYLLTPTRYLWSHEAEYRQTLPGFLQPLASLFQQLFQRWDRMAANRPDAIIPISHLVEQRATKYYCRLIEDPIYPGYKPLSQAEVPETLPPSDFIFSWGRHVAYKRFDLVIEAAQRLQLPLVITGFGPETERLKQQAANSTAPHLVQFVGRISDAQLAWYLQNASCAVFPQLEDFGIAPLEAVSQGCPVILHEKSGVAELLENTLDGITIPGSSVTELEVALQKIQAQTWNRLDIQSRARQYADKSFQENWAKKVQLLWKHHRQQLKGSL